MQGQRGASVPCLTPPCPPALPHPVTFNVRPQEASYGPPWTHWQSQPQHADLPATTAIYTATLEQSRFQHLVHNVHLAVTNLQQQPEVLTSSKLNEKGGGGELGIFNNGYGVYFCKLSEITRWRRRSRGAEVRTPTCRPESQAGWGHVHTPPKLPVRSRCWLTAPPPPSNLKRLRFIMEEPAVVIDLALFHRM